MTSEKPIDRPAARPDQASADAGRLSSSTPSLRIASWTTLAANTRTSGRDSRYHLMRQSVSGESVASLTYRSAGHANPLEPDAGKRKDIVDRLQKRLYDIGSFAVVGQYTMPTAYRSNIVGLIPSPALVLWNIDKQ